MNYSAAKTAKTSDNDLTAFVREVVLPGLYISEPDIDPKSCSFKLRYASSSIHRWGIFADEDIPARRRVIEYTGQKIDVKEVWRRSFRQHLYVFWLNEKWALDGAFGGSGAEFINHSCDPNLSTYIIRGRIFLSSKRRIARGEELTLDYNVDDDSSVVPCNCASENCRKVIGR
jgi:SET domain-containing protein